MKLEAAEQLAKALVRVTTIPGLRIFTLVAKRRDALGRVADARLVFMGGRQGEHSIDVGVSTAARALAHFEGYCENNGVARMPSVGQLVTFLSGSSSTGVRNGRVIAVGRTRATVAYRFAYGRKTTRIVPIAELIF